MTTYTDMDAFEADAWSHSWVVSAYSRPGGYLYVASNGNCRVAQMFVYSC